MKTNRRISKVALAENFQEFLDTWHVPELALKLRGNGDQPAVHIWPGRFVLGETVAITARHDTKVKNTRSKLYVGVINECVTRDLQIAGSTMLEAYVEQCPNRVEGLCSAVDLLIKMKGLPVEIETVTAGAPLTRHLSVDRGLL